jgi:hypothetical protein
MCVGIALIVEPDGNACPVDCWPPPCFPAVRVPDDTAGDAPVDERHFLFGTPSQSKGAGRRGRQTVIPDRALSMMRSCVR